MGGRHTLVLELTDEVLAQCEDVLDYQFEERSLLAHALTHASAARTRAESNERLEFLGDAILGVIVCEELFQRYPDSSEGELTRIKSVIVSRATCTEIAEDLGLHDYLLLGKGITSGERMPASISAAVFEAVVGAMYLDGGREVAADFILECIGERIELVAQSITGVNHKSVLQQLAQKRFSETPLYTVLDEKGPDHSKCFQIAAVIGTRVFSPAWGLSKKQAEQDAARHALQELDESLADA